MKYIGLALLFVAKMALAQGDLPWGSAVSVPALAAQSDVALFYVASYSWDGTHTDYDMARRDADAHLAANPTTPTYLVLAPGGNETCDDVPLPVVPAGRGSAATVSIIGYGSNVSSLIRRGGCGSSKATLYLTDSSAGPVNAALFQGFTVNADHLDQAACGFYGLTKSVLFDVACGNALPGSDHEVEFGNLDANLAGRDYGLAIYNLKAYDSVGVGKGALLTPLWTGNALTGINVTSQGASAYTQQFTRAQVIGPDVAFCETVPTLNVAVSNLGSVAFDNLPTTNYGNVTGATIQNSGNCASTSQLYILVQDGVPTTYGMKFTNLQASHVWNLEATSSSAYAEAWLPASANNTIIGEHPFTNQTIQIAEYALNDKHVNPFFDSPGAFGAAIYGGSGTFQNAVFSWDSETYIGSSGYLINAGPYFGWTIQNSQCTDSSPNFVSIVTAQGVLPTASSAPSGITLNDVETCDGTNMIAWPTQVASYPY